MTDAQALFFNPLQDGYASAPYPHFAEMRDCEPVHLSLLNQWFLFRHDDVSRLLRDPSLSVSDANVRVCNKERLAAVVDAFGPDHQRTRSMLGTDPPDACAAW